MNPKSNSTTMDEKERQHSVASVATTILMTESQEPHQDEGILVPSPQEDAVQLQQEDSEQSFACPEREQHNSTVAGSCEGDGEIDLQRPTSMECEIDPNFFPGDPPLMGRLSMDLDPSTTPEGALEASAATPETDKASSVSTFMPGTPDRSETEIMVVSINPGDILPANMSSVACKRPRPTDNSDSGDDSDINSLCRLRPRKARVIVESATDDDAQIPISVPPKSPPPCIIESTTGEMDTQPTDVDSTGQRRKKLVKKKTSPIAPKLHPLPETTSLKEHTTASLTALAMDWIDDIETIRRKSNWQGVMSKNIRLRLELFKETFRLVHNTLLRPDNPNLLQLRNARLVSENAALQKEIDSVRQQLDKYLREKSSVSLLKLSKEIRDVGTTMEPPLMEVDNSSPSLKFAEELAWIKNKLAILESGSNLQRESPPLPQRTPTVLPKKPVIKSIQDISHKKVVIVGSPQLTLPTPVEHMAPINFGIPEPSPGSPGLSPTPTPRTQKAKGNDNEIKKPLTYSDVFRFGESPGGPAGRGPRNPGSPENTDGPGRLGYPGPVCLEDPLGPGSWAPLPVPETKRRNVNDMSQDEDTLENS